MRRFVAMFAAGLLATGACTGGSEGSDAAGPRFEPSECPTELANAILTEIECGAVVVAEDRADPRGGQVRLFTVRIPPAQGAVAPDPILVIGGDLGVGFDYAGYAPLADRVRRDVIVMDPRGVGYSTPGLGCLELEELAVPSLEVASSDESVKERFLDRVDDCRERLQTSGVDLDAYGLEAMAADIEEVRMALDVEEWGLATYGSTSLIALEAMRRSPDHIRQVVLDSPSWPGLDPFTEGIEGTRHAVGQLAEWCSRHPRCARTLDDLAATTEQAIGRYQAVPVEIPTGGAGADVVVDGAMLLRVLRWQLARGETDRVTETVPSLLADLADGEPSAASTTLIADAVGGGQAYCIGYHPTCIPSLGVSQGSYFSVLCRDIVPFVDPAEVRRSAEGQAAYEEVFARSIYLDVCDRWNVSPGDPGVTEAVSSDVPTLVFVGRFDPFSSFTAAELGSRGLSRSWVVVDPVGGHNVLGISSCVRSVRDAWVHDPSQPPVEPECG